MAYLRIQCSELAYFSCLLSARDPGFNFASGTPPQTLFILYYPVSKSPPFCGSNREGVTIANDLRLRGNLLFLEPLPTPESSPVAQGFSGPVYSSMCDKWDLRANRLGTRARSRSIQSAKNLILRLARVRISPSLFSACVPSSPTTPLSPS